MMRLFATRQYIKPHENLNNQTVVIDEENNIRESLFKFTDEERKELGKSPYQLFQMGLEINPNNTCFGKRQSFDHPVVWQSYKQVDQNIRAFGSGLVKALAEHYQVDGGESDGSTLRCEQDVMIGICAANSPEWVYTQYGCSAYGMVLVPLYETLGEQAMEHILEQTNMKVVVIQTWVKAKEIFESFGHQLQLMIVVEPENDKTEAIKEQLVDKVKCLTFSQVLDLGSANLLPVRDPHPNDAALICYTSGSTGIPKGVIYTNQTIGHARMGFYRLLTENKVPLDSATHLSFLPLAHLMEQLIMSMMLSINGTVGFLTKNVAGLADDLVTFKPTILFIVPRLLVRSYHTVLKRVGTNRLLRKLLNRSIRARIKQQSKGIYQTGDWADRLFFKQIRSAYGDRVKVICSGSSPLPSEVLNFTRAAVGCPVFEGYGMTENGCVTNMTLLGDTSCGHVGTLGPDLKVKLANVPEMDLEVNRNGIGEICFKLCIPLSGYYKDEERTRELFDSDGFLHTGDIGRWTRTGALQIVDRCKNMFKLSQGEYIAPEKVEQVYAKSLLGVNYVLDGNSLHSFAILLMVPDFANLRQLMASSDASSSTSNGTLKSGNSKSGTPPPINYSAMSDEELCQCSEVEQRVLSTLNELGVTAGLKGFEQAKAVYLTTEEFTVANGMLTPSLKMARARIRAYFRDQIDALYERHGNDPVVSNNKSSQQ